MNKLTLKYFENCNFGIVLYSNKQSVVTKGEYNILKTVICQKMNGIG